MFPLLSGIFLNLKFHIIFYSGWAYKFKGGEQQPPKVHLNSVKTLSNFSIHNFFFIVLVYIFLTSKFFYYFLLKKYPYNIVYSIILYGTNLDRKTFPISYSKFMRVQNMPIKYANNLSVSRKT